MLVVNGTQINSPIMIENGTILAGTGTVGIVNAGGSVAPGPVSGVGILHGGSVNLGGPFLIDIAGDTAGTPGGGYDQLQVTGTVSLGGTLTVSFPIELPPLIGQQFTILDNDGVDPIAGTFQGLPEGSLLVVSNVVFVVSYAGGDGNDVVLTVVSSHTQRAAVAGQVYHDVNQNGARDPTEPGFAGWTVTVTGTDSQGNPVSLSTVTTGDDAGWAGSVSDSTVVGMAADLTALGMTVSGTFERIAEGSLPIE